MSVPLVTLLIILALGVGAVAALCLREICVIRMNRLMGEPFYDLIPRQIHKH